MAIFPREQSETKNNETVIGASVKVEGNFNGQGDVVVEGEVMGTLKTAKSLRVGPGAKIKADVQANSVFLAGQIRGNVRATEKIELAESAKLIGNVETKNITIASGAYFTGKCQMINGEGELVAEEVFKNNGLKNRNNKFDKK